MRRKTLRNSLQPWFAAENVEAALQQCKLDVAARAQDLLLPQLVALHHALPAPATSGVSNTTKAASADAYKRRVAQRTEQ